jgi:hypothetical protein
MVKGDKPLHLQISAKDLGALAMPDFCERCFWLNRHIKPLPWQTFPGIFSSIDAYTKKCIHAMIDEDFDSHSSLCSPFSWLLELGPVVGYIEPPTWRTFKVIGKNVTLTGSPDLILRMADGTIQIPDYKTAKYTEGQDKLMPIYEVQLNGYAWIAEQLKTYPRVSGISLIYFEPQTGDMDATDQRNWFSDGFSMKFKATIKPLEIKPGMILTLLQRAWDIYSGPMPEAKNIQCKDCHSLNNILQVILAQQAIREKGVEYGF